MSSQQQRTHRIQDHENTPLDQSLSDFTHRNEGPSNSEQVEALALARTGLRGGQGDYPHLDAISACLGDHDLYGVESFLGGLAQGACSDLGASAFAVGDKVAFSGTPDLWTAAHEAAHVIQQRSGISLSGGAGQQGDIHERNADAVADRIVAGRSAEDLLPDPSLARAQPAGVQCYSEEEDVNGNTVRVADDGSMVVKVDNGPDTDNDGNPDYRSGSQKFFADESHLPWWNDALDGPGSVIDLEEGEREYDAQDAGTSGMDDLHEVKPSNNTTDTSGKDMQLWADCGRSARDVMGAGDGTGGGKMSAVYNKERELTWFEETMKAAGVGDYAKLGDTVNEERTTTGVNPDDMQKEMLADLLDCDEDEAVATYAAMDPKARDAFDQKAGINSYAAPEVGEGFTIVSGGNSVPVTNPYQKDNNQDGMVDQWNFHWAGVVGKSGDDVVTLENYATGNAEDKNNEWIHQMHSPYGGQSFHEAHQATGQHGDMPMTMRVRERQ